jgi:hypothetical protein
MMASPTLHETLPGLEWLMELPVSSSTSRLSLSEGKEMLRYEQLLPLQALIAYRQQAVTEALLHAYERHLEKGLKSPYDRLPSSNALKNGSPVMSTPLDSAMSNEGASHIKNENDQETAERKNKADDEVDTDREGEGGGRLDAEKGAKKGKGSFKKMIKSIFKPKNKQKESGEQKDPRSLIPGGASGQGDSATHSDAMTSDISVNNSTSNKAGLKMISNMFVRRTYAGTERTADSYRLPPPPPASDDMSLQDISEALLGGIRNQEEGGTLLHLTIKASVSVRLSDTAALIDAHVSFGGDLTAKSVADLRVSCYLSDLRIEDLVTPTPVYRTLLSFAASDQTRNTNSTSTSTSTSSPTKPSADSPSEDTYQEQISLLYVTSSVGSSSLQAYSQPLQVAINVLCLERLSELVAARVAGLIKVVTAFNENDYLRKSAEWGAEGVITATTGADVASQMAAAIAGDCMDITVEVSSNKVILPMNTGKDEGSFVLDLGTAGLKGSYSPTSGLSLALSVSDLSAGMIPFGGLSDTCRDVGYVLQPVDAHLTFFVPGSDRNKDKCKDIAIATAAPSSTSTSHPASPPHPTAPSTSTSKVLKSGQTDSNPDATPAGTDPDLLIDLHVKSELQIALTPPKLVEIVKYSRIFISYVWNVYTIFTSHLGDSAKYITDEKLAQGLQFLNKVLNPTTREKKGEQQGTVKLSTPINRSKKRITKSVSKIFSMMTRSIAGAAVGGSVGAEGALITGEMKR